MSSRTETLFAGLVDDAAVFPPGNRPLPEALRAHLADRQKWHAPYVGPFLVPATAASELVAAADAAQAAGAAQVGGALQVALIARPNQDPALLGGAARTVAAAEHVDLAWLEAGWQPGWRSWPGEGARIVLELPRGDDQRRALDDVANAGAECVDAIAKFRTGPTPTWAWPDEEELAGVLVATAELDVPLKLTGGLHHVVRGEYGPENEPEHGLLNVLVAVDAAARGADADTLTEHLRVRDPEALADEVDSWVTARRALVRSAFPSFGCCAVLDPLTGLDDLDLFEER